MYLLIPLLAFEKLNRGKDLKNVRAESYGGIFLINVAGSVLLASQRETITEMSHHMILIQNT